MVHVKHIGPGMMNKVLELIQTGKMRTLEYLRRDDKFQSIDTLCDVWGIGPAKAMELFNKNIKTI